MNKEDDSKFLKIQTCVLKVNIHCDGCKQKVKKLLQKIDGVFQTAIDAEQGKVTVSGNVDPATLIKKLNKAGKPAELIFPKGVNLTHLQKPQPENPKLQQNKDNGKPPKGGASAGGGGGGKDHKNPATSLPSLQQMKGLKDLKLPQFKDMKLPFQKDPKSVKFALPPEDAEDGSDFDDFDDDYDEDDLDEFDSFDADFDDDFHNLELKPGNAGPNALSGLPMMPDKKAGAGGGGSGNGKKGGVAVDIPVQIKGMNGNNEAKNGKKNGGNQNNGGAGGGKNGGKGASAAGGQDAKNSGSNGKPNPNGNSGKKGGGKNEESARAAAAAGPFGPPAGIPPAGMNPVQLGAMPQMGNMPAAVQGLPAGMAPPGYFAGAGMPAVNPEMMAAAAGGGNNPYQQQYLAALMQQQQQQRMMMMNGQDRGYPPMMAYPRPPVPPPAMYMPPAHGEPYTNYFSDENANSCSIM